MACNIPGCYTTTSSSNSNIEYFKCAVCGTQHNYCRGHAEYCYVCGGIFCSRRQSPEGTNHIFTHECWCGVPNCWKLAEKSCSPSKCLDRFCPKHFKSQDHSCKTYENIPHFRTVGFKHGKPPKTAPVLSWNVKPPYVFAGPVLALEEATSGIQIHEDAERELDYEFQVSDRDDSYDFTRLPSSFLEKDLETLVSFVYSTAFIGDPIPFGTMCEQAFQLALARKDCNLSQLYLSFVRTPAIKSIVCSSLKSKYMELRTDYRSVKQEILGALLGKTEFKPLNHEGQTWQVRMHRLAGPDRDKPHYNLTEESSFFDKFCWLDMRGTPDWFTVMVLLNTLRKTMTQKKTRAQHLAILNFKGFSIFVVNTKDGNSGTTRMVLPVTRSLETLEYEQNKTRIRVLDMTYAEVKVLIKNCLMPAYCEGSDVELAKAMLGVLNGDKVLIGKLEKVPVPLGWFHCSFIYGMKLSDKGFEVDGDNWRISRKARAPKDLSKLGVVISLYEGIAYILSILFLAEPRHALGLYESTVTALKLIERGILDFETLLNKLEGNIKHGWLLPGANKLQILKNVQIPLKPLIAYNSAVVSTMASSSTSTSTSTTTTSTSTMTTSTATTTTTTPVMLCTKRTAMPLIDAIILPDSAERMDVCCEKAVGKYQEHEFVVYEPLMKCLFIEFLWIFAGSTQQNLSGLYKRRTIKEKSSVKKRKTSKKEKEEVEVDFNTPDWYDNFYADPDGNDT